MARNDFLVPELAEGVLSNQRLLLARALTLVESQLPAHRALAHELLDRLRPHAGGAHRIGITGPPGAGKSTLIEALGLLWTGQGERVGVLAIDPSSQATGGSILGDKTRMERLSMEEGAFLRPSPTRGALGGVARRTRECITVLEAAGYGHVVVETVGVGQSETAVAELVDTVLLVALPGAGDEVQGIKRGLMEAADLVFVNKAEGEQAHLALASAQQLSLALRMLSSRTAGWMPQVLTGSARSGDGVERLLHSLAEHLHHLRRGRALEELRGEQALHWFRHELEDGLLSRFFGRPEVRSRLNDLEDQVRAGHISPDAAARSLLGEG